MPGHDGRGHIHVRDLRDHALRGRDLRGRDHGQALP